MPHGQWIDSEPIRRWWRYLVCHAAVLAFVVGPVTPQAQVEEVVTHVVIEGPLDAGTVALVQRSIREARGAGEHLVVELDTPGGQIFLMRQIAQALDDAAQGGLIVTAWVADKALSAGVFISISGDRVYARERAQIGSAQAVIIGPTGIRAASEKESSAYRAWARAWAETHGRDPALAMAMVDPGVEVRRVSHQGVDRFITGKEWDDLVERGETPELIGTVVARGELLGMTGQEALGYGYADGIAESLDEVVGKIGMAGSPIHHIDRSRSEDLMGMLAEYRMLILLIALMLAFLELKMPGFGLPGILSIACFGLMFLGQYMVGLADIPDIVLASVGVVLIAVELFVVPGTLWVGMAGIVCLVAGLVLGQIGPGLDLDVALDRKLVFDAVSNLVLTALVAFAGMWAIARFLPDTPVLNRLVLRAEGVGGFGSAVPEAAPEHLEVARPGVSGVARTDLRPVGLVVLDSNPDHEYEARVEGPALDRGVRVRVLEATGGRLIVEAEASS